MGGQAQRSNFYSAATRGQGRRDEAEAGNKAWVRVWSWFHQAQKETKPTANNHTNSLGILFLWGEGNFDLKKNFVGSKTGVNFKKLWD